MAKLYRHLMVFLFFPLLILAFQNCRMVNTGSSRSVASKPVYMCGIEGYNYLLKNYFLPNCGSCHENNGFKEPYFADVDLELSYTEALTIPAHQFIETSTHNSFCLGDCNLKEGDELLYDLEVWLANRECDSEN